MAATPAKPADGESKRAPDRHAPAGFPNGFVSARATSAYQGFEGAVDEDGRGRSIWNTLAHTGSTNHSNSNRANDHYHRYRQNNQRRFFFFFFFFVCAWLGLAQPGAIDNPVLARHGAALRRGTPPSRRTYPRCL